ncbi:hypothetical protein PPYR_14263 [Photinus pyralis]|uniref:Cytochrome P450 n=1 Tax=Photinus pyralis TaxID=7054 RepID=A0A1Y1NGN2_PHOPY|nr:probable cytochrome P450 305a1 [Photinus pyralis]KAB0792304.1 hypothetical protein PPYR_14263 [Photinus pyralis]
MRSQSEEMLLLLVIALIFLVSVLLYYSSKKPHNYPPGPPWLPVVGSLPYVRRFSKRVGRGQHDVLREMCKHWNTNVLGLKAGEQLLVAVCDYPIIKKMLDSEVYNARPNNFFGKLRTIGSGPGITCAEGKLWVEQKRFIVRHLRDIGLGKEIMEEKIREEIEDVTCAIDEQNGTVEIGRLVQPAVINLIWFLVAGARIKKNEAQFERLLELLERRSNVFDMAGGKLGYFPWLRFIVPEAIGYNLIKRLNAELNEFLMETIEDHQRRWVEGCESDLMYAFITQMKAMGGASTNFTSEQLLMVCLDLFVAGAHSTSSTLDYAFLMMLLHPDVQLKVQQILDANFGREHKFSYPDWRRVPYVQAVLLEVQRYCSVIPIASRRVYKDVVLEGYNIPKDTTVLVNLQAVLMDETIWGDPRVFRPERFLDGDKLASFDEFVPFSTGRRKCLGEPFAKTCLFIFFAEIIRKYSIVPLKGRPLPTTAPLPGIIALPQRYSAQFIRRSELYVNIKVV